MLISCTYIVTSTFEMLIKYPCTLLAVQISLAVPLCTTTRKQVLKGAWLF